jgi:putative flippase GtrA
VMHFNYLFATAIAVEAAVVHNFVWHEQFTWVDRTKVDRTISDRAISDRTISDWTISDRAVSWRRSLLRLLRFNLSTGAVSILGNLALMKVMVGVGHMNYLLANAIAIILCSLANFLVSEAWVFQRE